MARKNYTEEFRRQAVDLYRSTPGATLRGIAADLGISRHTLQVWVHALDPNPTSPSSELCRTRREAGTASEAARVATERDILRQAASISPGRRTGEPVPVRP
jgi:transposase